VVAVPYTYGPHIEIDQARNRQVAEIAETEYFQQLQRQAKELRNSVEESEFQLEAKVLRELHYLGDGWELPFSCCNPEMQPEAAKPLKLDLAFVDHCRQEFACRVSDRGYLLEKILAEQPDISSVQLVEALAAEILNPQQAVEFRQCLLADGVTISKALPVG